MGRLERDFLNTPENINCCLTKENLKKSHNPDYKIVEASISLVLYYPEFYNNQCLKFSTKKCTFIFTQKTKTANFVFDLFILECCLSAGGAKWITYDV